MHIVIPVHSFVDLITNSSSELFVCNGNKSVATMRELIVTIANARNQIVEASGVDTPVSDVFNGVLQEPYAAKYSFDYAKLASDARDEYEKYHEHPGKYCWSSSDPDNPENKPRYLALKDEENEMRRKLGVDISWRDLEKLSPEARKTYDTNSQEANKKASAIWADYRRDKFRAHIGLFVAFLVYNGFAQGDIDIVIDKMDKTKPRGDFGWYDLDLSGHETLREAYDDFGLYLSYGMVVNKGDIMVRSDSDNSIPYDLMETLETHLGARRYHIS
jgi:hypothetical protein